MAKRKRRPYNGQKKKETIQWLKEPEALKSLYRSPGNKKKTNWSYLKTMSCVILELRST
jgi:hypothetical protein